MVTIMNLAVVTITIAQAIHLGSKINLNSK